MKKALSLVLAAVMAFSLVACDGSAYMDKSSGEWIPEDYETAKAMAQQALADAGYPNGEGFPTITYSTNDAGYHKAVAEYLQQCYKEVLGINLEIEIVEWSSFTPMRRAGDYEMARNGWSFDYNDFWLQSPDLQGTWHSPYGYWYLQYAYIGEPAEDTAAESESVATSTAAESTDSEATESAASESAESTSTSAA